MSKSFLAVAVAVPLLGALSFAACSSTSTGGGIIDLDGSAFGDSAANNPCGANGVYGTYQINGTLEGTEQICGLDLGSFDGGALTIAQAGSGATVTVTNSGDGFIDVASCAATVSGCDVTTSACSGSTNNAETVTLSLSTTATAISGSSQLGFNSCQAPGLSFNGTR